MLLDHPNDSETFHSYVGVTVMSPIVFAPVSVFDAGAYVKVRSAALAGEERRRETRAAERRGRRRFMEGEGVWNGARKRMRRTGRNIPQKFPD